MAEHPDPSADQAWNELLRELREQPVAPRPFFYTRLQARLADTPPLVAAPETGWLRRPAFAVVMALLMVVLHADSVSSSSYTAQAVRGAISTLPASRL